MPYNPQAQDISGQLIGQGLASFGQGIGSGIEAFYKQKKDEEKRLKDVNTLKKAIGGFAEQLGIPKAQWDALGSLEGIGAAINVITQSHNIEAAKLGQKKNQIELNALQTDIRNRQRSSEKNFDMLSYADEQNRREDAENASTTESVAKFSQALASGMPVSEAIKLHPGAVRNKEIANYVLEQLKPKQEPEIFHWSDGEPAAMKIGNTVVTPKGKLSPLETERTQAEIDLLKQKAKGEQTPIPGLSQLKIILGDLTALKAAGETEAYVDPKKGARVAAWGNKPIDALIKQTEEAIKKLDSTQTALSNDEAKQPTAKEPVKSAFDSTYDHYKWWKAKKSQKPQ